MKIWEVEKNVLNWAMFEMDDPILLACIAYTDMMRTNSPWGKGSSNGPDGAFVHGKDKVYFLCIHESQDGYRVYEVGDF